MLQHIKKLLKANSLFLAILITLTITVLSLIKLGPQPINFSNLDKVQHAIAYMFLSFFWLLAYGSTKQRGLIIIIACIVFGTFIEFMQNTTSYRTFDYLDMVANSIGVILGYLIFSISKKTNILSN